MKNYSVFDILGPIMIGPSSSHTAGAQRLGRAARSIAGDDFKSVTFLLHGSFAKTYKGHGTDKALTAGILGMDTQDENIKNSLPIAEKKGIKISFAAADLGDVHPNTVKIIFHRNDGSDFYVTGSSIGGGNIIITDINGNIVEFNGQYPIIIIKHKDRVGMISKMSSIVAASGINIASFKVDRELKGEIATAVIETDTKISKSTEEKLLGIKGVVSVNSIDKVL